MKRSLIGILLSSTCLFHYHLYANAEFKIPAPWKEHVLSEKVQLPDGREATPSCALGDPFSIFVSPGNPDKLVIDFIGGGACFNYDNCSPDSMLYVKSIQEFKEKYYGGQLAGVYNKFAEDNPLKNHTHVVVSYCTGDLHWGSNLKTYTQHRRELQIHHYGAINALAALKWTKKRYGSVQEVHIIGTSAGAYAAPYWLSYIREKAYPEAKISLFGDGGISPVTEKFSKQAMESWKPQRLAPQDLPGVSDEDVDWSKLQITDFYKALFKKYPEIRMAHATSAFDVIQLIFYTFMGGDGDEWYKLTNQNLVELSKYTWKTENGVERTSNFKYFRYPGDNHCVIPFQRFDKVRAKDGTLFKDWFTDFLNGDSVENKVCTDCEEIDVEIWKLPGDPDPDLFSDFLS